MSAEDNRQTAVSPRDPAPERVEPEELGEEDRELMEDIAQGIDRKLRSLGVAAPTPRRDNVSFVINCGKRLKERKWDLRRQRRICVALEQRYLAQGWKFASIYVMEHDHLRLRATFRTHPSPRGY